MGRSAWRDWLPPDDGAIAVADRPEPRPDAPREAGIYFGAQVGWNPERESGRSLAVEWACDLASRAVLIVELCSECLSGFGDVKLADRVVCAGCLRYSRDARVSELLAIDPPPSDDPDSNIVGVESGKTTRFRPKGS